MEAQPDSFQGTELGRLLRERGVTTLVVAGIATEHCVDTTVRSAYARGYKVVLVADSHGTWSDDVAARQIVAHHNRILARFGSVRPASEVQFE